MSPTASSPLAAHRKDPAPYYYLWHLAALNVLSVDFGPVPPGPLPARHESALRDSTSAKVTATLWDKLLDPKCRPGPAARIALIDTGVSLTHPNLHHRIVPDSAIDLATHRYGARCLTPGASTGAHRPETPQPFFDGLDVSALGPLGLAADAQALFDELVIELCASTGVTRHILDLHESLASHGTAVAGLMVGAPADWEDGIEADPQRPSNDRSRPDLLPYFGVDPFSTLIPIRTSFEDDPHQFIAAFLYAWHSGADVIVLPRGLPDPVRGALCPKEDLTADLETWENREIADLFHRLSVTGEDRRPTHRPEPRFTDARLWTILEHLIVALSRKIPVVCAAGNDGESQLIYPANLAAPDNGVIAVGAVTAQGFRSGYSSYGPGLTVVAPSDDSEVFNRHQQRFDRQIPGFDGPEPAAGGRDEPAYCHLGLTTTDLPGIFGYDAGTPPWSKRLPDADGPGLGGGNYTDFGGTSGAAGLVGGVVALVQRARKRDHGKAARLGGASVKSILISAANTSAVVAPGFRPLSPDRMNGQGEEAAAASRFFGAGLVDAAKAVDLARSA